MVNLLEAKRGFYSIHIEAASKSKSFCLIFYDLVVTQNNPFKVLMEKLPLKNLMKSSTFYNQTVFFNSFRTF